MSLKTPPRRGPDHRQWWDPDLFYMIVHVYNHNVGNRVSSEAEDYRACICVSITSVRSRQHIYGFESQKWQQRFLHHLSDDGMRVAEVPTAPGVRTRSHANIMLETERGYPNFIPAGPQ